MPRRGSPGHRSRGAWLAAALALALVPASALAQEGTADEEPEGPHLILDQVTADLSYFPDLNLLQVYYNETPPAAFLGGDCSPGDYIVKDPANRRFTFSEGEFGTGCGSAILDIVPPPGASFVLVNFTADRNITTPEDLPSPTQIVMPQTFVLTAVGPGFTSEFDVFNEFSGSSPPVDFARGVPLPSDVTAVNLNWSFADLGTTIPGNPLPYTAGTYGLTAVVGNITLSWPGLPLATQALPAGMETVEDGISTTPLNLTLAVPEDFVISPDQTARPPTTTSLAITVVEGPTIVAVTGPRGPLASNEYVVVEGDQRIRALIGPAVVARQGPGIYTVHYEMVRTLPPPPPTPEPTTIYPFYFALALLPMAAAVLAIHQGNLYVRQAEGPYKRTAWPVFIAVLLVVAYYVLLLLYSFFGVGPTRMSTTPLGREPLLIYIQFVLLLLMLAFSALAVSRTLIANMRRDIAERNRKEDQLRRSNEELERFAYVASHDLQEPLRKVAGFTALLQKRYEGQLDKDADEIIQYAVDGATRMQMLIKDILAYSRVGSKELNRVPVDANATMQLVASDLSVPIKEHRALVRWDPLPTVRADASQLRQVLQNLVENAIKYRQPGRRPRIDVRAYEDGGDWHFEVRDNGQGIPADKHEEIFGIFRRLHGQDLPGTGIGLAVCKKAIERHGGRIWVESSVGKGSTFHFKLPRGSFEAPGRWLPTTRARGAAA